MRLAVAAAAAALLAACGPKAQSHTSQPAPAPVTCDNVVAPPIPSFVTDELVQDLGTVAVGATAPFTVPAGTAAFFIVSQALGTAGDGTFTWSGTSGIPNVVVPTSVQAPSGTVYYDDWATPPSTTISGVTYSFDYTTTLAEPGLDTAVGVFSFPNTSAALQKLASTGSVEPGPWHFRVNDWSYECAQAGTACTGGSAGSQYHVYVVTRPTPTSTPTLDVDVFLATDPATSPLPDAATATTNVQVARWKQSLQSYLGNGGIALGTVTFHDLPAAAKAQYAPSGDVDVGSSGPCSDLSQLFASASSQTRGVSIFLADQLLAPTIGGSYRVAGVDGSIPGPSGFPGTVNSGAVVGLENLEYEATPSACSGAPNLSGCGADRTAYVTAHEIGHWLGLYHVTEQDGTMFDPLDDTRVCPCHACAPAGQQASCADVNPSVSPSAATLVTAQACTASAGCGGGDNLMFWVVSATYSTGALSAEQQQVIQLNPALH